MTITPLPPSRLLQAILEGLRPISEFSSYEGEAILVYTYEEEEFYCSVQRYHFSGDEPDVLNLDHSVFQGLFIDDNPMMDETFLPPEEATGFYKIRPM